jgi:hypothetical protein
LLFKDEKAAWQGRQIKAPNLRRVSKEEIYLCSRNVHVSLNLNGNYLISIYSGPVIKKKGAYPEKQTHQSIDNAKAAEKLRSLLVTECAGEFNY